MAMRGSPRHVNGYPKLAHHMGASPEIAIFRRFGTLNAQNLLYLQAELVHLEKKLGEFEKRDSQSSEGMKSQYARDWFWLSRSENDGNDDQWQTVLAVRKKLVEYNKAVEQQMVLTSLPIPRREDLASIQSWLERPMMGNWSLLGHDSDTWGSISNPESHAPDLFTFRARHDADPFSEWVARQFIVWFHNWIGYRFHKICDPDTGIIYYDDEKLLRLTYFVTTVSASLIPIISVIALYYVKTVSARLSLVTLFMFLFAANLTYFASAKRIDVFVATAAFAAVQVVFVGSNPHGSSNI